MSGPNYKETRKKDKSQALNIDERPMANTSTTLQDTTSFKRKNYKRIERTVRLVEESNSEWSSPMVIVKKKDLSNHM